MIERSMCIRQSARARRTPLGVLPPLLPNIRMCHWLRGESHRPRQLPRSCEPVVERLTSKRSRGGIRRAWMRPRGAALYAGGASVSTTRRMVVHARHTKIFGAKSPHLCSLPPRSFRRWPLLTYDPADPPQQSDLSAADDHVQRLRSAGCACSLCALRRARPGSVFSGRFAGRRFFARHDAAKH